MRPDALTILRCPYCGGRLTVDETVFHRFDGDAAIDAVLSCQCSQFPVVSGIAVMTVEGVAETAREQVADGDPAGALRTMAGGGDEGAADRFAAAIASPSATYRDCADAHVSLPFASGAFRLAVCSDAFHYIWTKRLLSAEMLRLIGDDGAVALTHAHNSGRDNPSAGMPLAPDGYRALFEPLDSRAFS